MQIDSIQIGDYSFEIHNDKESKFINFLTEGKDFGQHIFNRGVINFRQVNSNLNNSAGGFMFKHTNRETTVLEYAYTLIKENGDIIHDKDSTILPNVNDAFSGLMTPAQKAKLDSLGTIPVYNSIEEVPSDITSKCIVTVDDIPHMMEKCSMMTDKDTAPVSTYKLWTTLYTDKEEEGTGAITYISYMRYIDGQWTNVYDDFAYDYFTNLRLTADVAAGLVRDSFRGKPDGIASLDSNGIIPSSQLPSYVDDVIEVYATYNKDNAGNLSNIQIYTDAAHTNSITGESGKIYVNIAENEPNYQLRWSGSEFVQISAGGLVIGEVEGTAFDGKAGKNLKDWQDSKDATLPDVFITSIGSPTQTNEGVRFGVSRRDKDATKDSQYNLSLNNATNTTNGLMSGKDKLKLNSLYNIDSLKILEAYDATSRQYTVNLVKNVYGIGTAGNISENLTISSATSTEAGLMSAQDKVLFDKLGIDPDGLTVYTLYILFGQGFAMSDTFAFNATADELSFNWRGFKSGPNYVPGSTEQSINDDTGKRVLPLATATTAGVMSAEDKSNLDKLKTFISNKNFYYRNDSNSINIIANRNNTGKCYLVAPNINVDGVANTTVVQIPEVSSTSNGLMSVEDKNKLDNVSGSIIYSTVNVDNEDGTSVIKNFNFIHVNGNVQLAVPTINTDTGVTTVYSLPIPTATSEHNGVMSKEDKVKLDNIDNIPTYTSVSEVPVDVTAKQIKLIIGGEECLFTRAKNGTYIAFAGGVNSQAGNTEKLEFIVLTPHLDADNNIDSWVTTSHISIDEAKYKSLVTTINDLSAKIDNLTSRLLVLEGYHQIQRRD